MELKPGMYLQGDKYRIIKVLGNGGFGITYLAEHELAGRNVCIKEFFPKEYYNRTSDSRNVSLGSQGSAPMMDAYKAKFIKEAKTIARLDHPNIIHIHDVFTENNTAYYVMEYIEGEPFSEIVSRDGAMKEADAVEYIRIVASAIAYIHEQRIMHLDIKPANVMLRKRDNRAILIDFGLSKQYDGDGHQTSSTPVGISAGYAPMEQYQQGGVKEFSPETDIYSLGATLYTLVTGAIPPQAAIIADEGFPELPSHLSAGVRRAIETSMLIQRRRRPHSTEEFLALLDNNVAAAPMPGDGEATILPPQQPLTPPSEDTIITPPVKEQPKVEPRKAEQPKPTPTPTTPKKRSKWWLWLLLLLIAVGGFVGYMMSGGDEPEPTPTPTYEPIPETVVEAEAVIEEQSEVTIAPAEPVVNEPVVNEPAPTPAPTFTLAKSSLTVDSSGGSHSVGYTIEHPIDGASVSVSDNQSWITNLSASGGKITFKTTDNTSTESRTGTITATYNGITRQITVTQKGAERITSTASSPININGHTAVDLGLSVKWATCNVGATSPEDYGNYYAWGETTTKTSYNKYNYQHWGDSDGDGDGDWDYGEITINTDISGTQYDAARANWGSGWRMPTDAEFHELIDNCTWTWTTRNGVNGYEVKSNKNGNSIFLPAAGYCNGDTHLYKGSNGDYWSSTPDGTYFACYLSVRSGNHVMYVGGRQGGLSVRPVAE